MLDFVKENMLAVPFMPFCYTKTSNGRIPSFGPDFVLPVIYQLQLSSHLPYYSYVNMQQNMIPVLTI